MSRVAISAAVAATLLATAAPALAAPAFPPMPARQKLGAVRLPAIERVRLDNGMTLVMVPFGSVPQVLVSLTSFAGEADTGGRPWLAGLHADVIQQGTATMDTKALSDAFADIGGNLSTSASTHATYLSTGALSEHAATAIRLVGDVARRPAMREADFARMKANKLRELAQAEASPQAMADKLLAEAVFGDSPYGRTVPSKAELEAMTLADVRAFHDSQMGAARSTLYVIGQFDPAAVKAAANAAFGDWAAGPARVVPSARFAAGPRLILADRPDSAQTTVRVAFAAPTVASADDIGYRVMDQLIAGSFSSRITHNIREQKGYTYSPGSTITPRPGIAHWVWDGDITPAVTGAAMKEVFGEIRGLQAKAPGAAETATFQTATGTYVLLRMASADTILGQLQRMDYLGYGSDYLANYVQKAFAVSPAAIRDQARRYLPLDKLVMVAIGDMKTVEPQLMALPELKGASVTRVTLPKP